MTPGRCHLGKGGTERCTLTEVTWTVRGPGVHWVACSNRRLCISLSLAAWAAFELICGPLLKQTGVNAHASPSLVGAPVLE